MAFGGFGTPGGFGATYPMRDMAQTPNSDVVTWTPDAKRFEANWLQEWNAAEPVIGWTDPTQLVVGAEGYNANTADPYKQQLFDQMTTQKLLGAGVSQDDLTPELLADYQTKVGGADNFLALQGMPYSGGFDLGGSYAGGTSPNGASHMVSTAFEDNSRREELLAQMKSMMPLFQNQAVQQSAYNSMNGGGQLNGILGKDYSNPTFGQVTNNPGLSQGTLDILAGSATPTTGTYDPLNSSSGVFGAPRR
jgi:hypothetical protein